MFSYASNYVPVIIMVCCSCVVFFFFCLFVLPLQKDVINSLSLYRRSVGGEWYNHFKEANLGWDFCLPSKKSHLQYISWEAKGFNYRVNIQLDPFAFKLMGSLWTLQMHSRMPNALQDAAHLDTEHPSHYKKGLNNTGYIDSFDIPLSI